MDHDLSRRRVGVSLSSGFFGFFAHAGFLAALAEVDVRPRAVTGCSAGALVGALYASCLDAGRIRDLLCEVRLKDFVDPFMPWDLWHRPFGLLRGNRLERSLARRIPVSTFEECRVPLALTMFDLEQRELRVVHEGPLLPALRASLSLPGMFQPAPVDGRLCWDGGVVEKTPLTFLLARDDLDTIIVCYLDPPSEQSLPRSLFSGIRTAQMTLIAPADQRAVDEARSRGMDVLVVAPTVPRCGPHRLSSGPSIVETARVDTLRILRDGALGHADLR